MPLHEYKCRHCGALIEVLVRSASERPACTACGSRALTRQLSTFAPAVKSAPACAGGSCGLSGACAPRGGCSGGTCPMAG